MSDLAVVEKDEVQPNAELSRLAAALHPGDPERQAVMKQLDDVRERVGRAIAAAETKFLESLRPLTREPAWPQLEAVLLERRLVRAGGAERDGTPGLLPTVLGMMVARDAGTSIEEPGQLARYTELLREMASLLERRQSRSRKAGAKSRETLLEYFTVTQEGVLDAAVTERVAQLAAERKTAWAPVRDDEKRIRAGNRRALEWAARALPPDDAKSLVEQWRAATFPEIYPDKGDLAPLIERVKLAPDLSDDQMAQLAVLEAEYDPRVEKINRELEQAITDLHELTLALVVYAAEQAEADAEIERLKTSRAVMHSEHAARLAALLTPEQVQWVAEGR